MTKKVVDIAAQTVTFTFDDETSEVFELGKVSPEIRIHLALHGASQKGGDSYAGASSADDPMEYAKAACRDTIAQLYAGDWRVTAAAGPRITDLATAVARVTGKDLEEVVEVLEGLDEAQKKALRKRPQVAAMLAMISQEKATAKAARLVEAAKGAGPLSLVV